MTINDVKPCPFCGVQATVKSAALSGDYISGYQVVCLGCEAQGPRAPTENEAVAGWSRRPTEGALLAIVVTAEIDDDEEGEPPTGRWLALNYDQFIEGRNWTVYETRESAVHAMIGIGQRILAYEARQAVAARLAADAGGEERK